jgi:hypothetical protein
MSLFSKKDKAPYKIKLVERIQYLAGSEKDLEKLEQRKSQFIEEAKIQLVEQSNQKLMLVSKYSKWLLEKEKQMLITKIKDNPFFDIDKDLEIPYYNIRKAIGRAHAY